VCVLCFMLNARVDDVDGNISIHFTTERLLDINTVFLQRLLIVVTGSENHSRHQSLSDMLTYHDLTHHIIPGPQSYSYFIPHLLLPLALLTPRSLLSRWQSIALFMPIIAATTLHAWWMMGGVDVISVDTLLHALLLLVLKDPWADFRYVLKTGTDGHADTGDIGLPLDCQQC